MYRYCHDVPYLQVSYHNDPINAYEEFVNILASRYLDHGKVIPSLLGGHNPAGKSS